MSVRWKRTDRGVYRATIDRPGVKNAIDFATMDDLEGLVDRVEADDQARLLALTGAGDTFVSGGDLNIFANLEDDEEVASMSRRMKRLLVRLEQLNCWTVACINGPAFGGGCEMALAFDFRIGAADCRFGFVQARLAIPPGWGGLTRLVQLVGRSQALLWLGTGAIVDAKEARDAGLVDQLAVPGEFDDLVDGVIGRLADNSPQLIAALKQGARRAVDEPRDEALKAELKPFCQLWGSDAHRRQLEAFFDGDST